MDNQPMRNTNTSAYYKDMEKIKGMVRYSAHNSDQDQDHDEDEQQQHSPELQSPPRQLNGDLNLDEKAATGSSANKRLEVQLQQSSAKRQVWEQQIASLQREKELIEAESKQLQRERADDNTMWQDRVETLQQKH